MKLIIIPHFILIFLLFFVPSASAQSTLLMT